jgi:2-polyprenyl-6-methoxyphenol hydroxylase-like FAD-dependent oxidoreductase
MSNSLLAGQTVAIIGAGPAGLTLARLLQMRGVRVQVYERDASPHARDQGGTLDLHEDSGQLALSKAGLSDRVRSVFRHEGQATKVFDKHGRIAAELRAEDEAHSRPEIDRVALRDLLLDSLTPNTVLWDRPLQRVAADGGRPRRRRAGRQPHVRSLA